MKVGMRFGMVALMEAIHVELPDKRRIVVVFEVSGQYLVGEARHTVNQKWIALRTPTDHLLQLRVLSAAKRTSTIYSSFDTKSGAWLRPRLLRLRFILLYTVEYAGIIQEGTTKDSQWSAWTQQSHHLCWASQGNKAKSRLWSFLLEVGKASRELSAKRIESTMSNLGKNRWSGHRVV